MLLYWPKLLYPYYGLLIFSLSVCRLVLWGWGLRTDRVYTTLSQPCTANLFLIIILIIITEMSLIQTYSTTLAVFWAFVSSVSGPTFTAACFWTLVNRACAPLFRTKHTFRYRRSCVYFRTWNSSTFYRACFRGWHTNMTLPCMFQRMTYQ